MCLLADDVFEREEIETLLISSIYVSFRAHERVVKVCSKL